jgi:hypothetical protein
MRSKFVGLLAVIAMPAILVLFTVPETSKSSADAGILRAIFGGQSSCGGLGARSYSASCGGLGAMSSCGGGNLQMMSYSSCGGGGGGLQSAFYYNPAPVQYYAPASFSSGCPGGVCPIPGGGGTVDGGLTFSRSYYAPTYASAPVPLNPGEVYVAGSLRMIERSQSIARNPSDIAPEARVAESKGDTVPAARIAPQRATNEGITPLANGFELVQLTQDDCHVCENDRQKARQDKIPLRVLSFSETEQAMEIAEICRQIGQMEESPDPVTGTPYYVLMKNGEVYKTKLGHMEDFGSAVKVAQSLKPETTKLVSHKEEVPEVPATDLTVDKLDRIEEAMMQLVDEMKATRQSIEGLRTVSR